MTIKMLIDASHEEETRVAIVHGSRVEEFDYESSAKKQIKGNIYLAKITRVEPSLQAAFVEYGGNRHGFLAFSEIHPDYYQIPVSDREALIAEESAAYAKILAEDEDVPEPKPKRKTRKRSPRKKKLPEESKEDVKEDVKEEAKKDDDVTAVTESDAKPPEEVKSENDETVNTDEPSITKAESVGEPDIITEDIPEDDVTDAEDTAEEDDPEDKAESAGSDLLDEEEAEEKLRIKIAKGLRRKYKIQEVIKKNQVILIQVVKEERGNKGAALTTYLSLPGRYCVLMPNTLHSGGVSRKIASVSERKSMKKILSDLNMPSGIACIIRTAGQSRTKSEIKRDFDYLIRTWEGIRERTLNSVAPQMINEEGDLIKRSIRDLYTREIDEILVEGEAGYKTARNFMRLLMPSHARKIKHYTDPIPLLHKFQVESQLDSMYSPTVQLKSGGYIVINPTEALVSIDVNSGKATKGHNIEETARKTNLEAAEEVARQLRLRDMAGLIVIDFIDMDVRSNNRAVEQKIKESLKSDRARIQVGRISSFGLMEMSRQRLRAGVLESSTRACPHCEGSGLIRSVETQVLHILRALEDEGIKGRNDKVTLFLPEQTTIYMLNNKRAKLVSLEEQYKMTIEVAIDTSLTEASYRLEMLHEDAKKPARTQAKQGNSRSQGQNNNQNRDRSANTRRNRQRNQSRRNKDQNPSPENDDSQKNESTPHEADNMESDNAGDKPRRRRRSRRNNRKPSDAATSENTEAGPSTSPANGGGANDLPSPSVEAPEKKADNKPARRPYPPQARSRRKDNPTSADDKKAPAPVETKAPVKTKAPEPEHTGPKKTGWWSRTFG